jgi:hypothetical protein
MTNTRRTELWQLLGDSWRPSDQDVQSRTRDGRAGKPAARGGMRDDSAAGSHGAIELAVLQGKAEALGRLDEALGRIEAGDY